MKYDSGGDSPNTAKLVIVAVMLGIVTAAVLHLLAPNSSEIVADGYSAPHIMEFKSELYRENLTPEQKAAREAALERARASIQEFRRTQNDRIERGETDHFSNTANRMPQQDNLIPTE